MVKITIPLYYKGVFYPNTIRNRNKNRKNVLLRCVIEGGYTFLYLNLNIASAYGAAFTLWLNIAQET